MRITQKMIIYDFIKFDKTLFFSFEIVVCLLNLSFQGGYFEGREILPRAT